MCAEWNDKMFCWKLPLSVKTAEKKLPMQINNNVMVNIDQGLYGILPQT